MLQTPTVVEECAMTSDSYKLDLSSYKQFKGQDLMFRSNTLATEQQQHNRWVLTLAFKLIG